MDERIVSSLIAIFKAILEGVSEKFIFRNNAVNKKGIKTQRRHSLRCTFSCGIMILDLFISVVFIQGSIAAKSKGLGIPSKCQCADSRFLQKGRV